MKKLKNLRFRINRIKLPFLNMTHTSIRLFDMHRDLVSAKESHIDIFTYSRLSIKN